MTKHLCLGIVAAAVSFTLPSSAFANKSSDRVQNRADRLDNAFEKQEIAEEIRTRDWSKEKLALNLDLRVPLGDARMYFAATGADSAKRDELDKTLEPVALELARLARGGPYRGDRMPRDLGLKTEALRDQVYRAVERVFDRETELAFRSYLEVKYQAIRDLANLRGSDAFYIVGDLPY